MTLYGKKITPNIYQREGGIGSLIVVTSFGVQGDLLAAPPLQKFSSNGPTTELIFSKEPKPETEPEETNLKTSSYVSQDEASTE